MNLIIVWGEGKREEGGVGGEMGMGCVLTINTGEEAGEEDKGQGG